MSASTSGSRWRRTSAVTRSPTASSICGKRSRAGIAAISARSGMSRSLTWRGSDVAAPDVGDEARLALVEADQHRALLDDVAHREARALAVAPVGPAHRPQDALGADLAEMPQRILERALLGRDLRGDVEVLHLAAAADAEVRAARHDALRAAHGEARRSVACSQLFLRRLTCDANLFARQRILDEDDLAFAVVGDALRLEIERLDPKPFLGARHGLDYPGRGRAAKLRPPGESFVRAKPPKAQTVAMPRSNAQATRTGKRLFASVLAGERPAASGSTEGASNAVRGAANLSGRADSRGSFPAGARAPAGLKRAPELYRWPTPLPPPRC